MTIFALHNFWTAPKNSNIPYAIAFITLNGHLTVNITQRANKSKQFSELNKLRCCKGVTVYTRPEIVIVLAFFFWFLHFGTNNQDVTGVGFEGNEKAYEKAGIIGLAPMFKKPYTPGREPYLRDSFSVRTCNWDTFIQNSLVFCLPSTPPNFNSKSVNFHSQIFSYCC